ncbi:hypothetical protein [Sedimenticola sp.]|uniref:hypothetical protein n=1 Tax=Sedimenticola sp. TaxID=1940285 RepID=UPI003D0CB59C
MERYTFLGVLVFSLLAVVIGIFLVPGRQVEDVRLPWQVESTPSGESRVFGVEIGRSTLTEVQDVLRETAELSLFENADGKRMVEAYFNDVDISGLRARVILVMVVDEEQLAGMYQRGERLINMGAGKHRVTLAQVDTDALKQATFSSLSYIPRANLDAKLVKERFGEPVERINEGKSGVEHWLYPDKGLDIVMDPEGKEILQYVRPAMFELVRHSLQEQATAGNP